ncbi:MAG: Nif3-like dinuclear metal center hexameric protein [Methylococcaceae bacterium]|nr:MAG: Nif3-like dinuclear metal center hexameric protein [Methylococcaceae bacterium]
MTINRLQVQAYFDQLLAPQSFSDYGPNGLQIEGTDAIARIAFAVSATADSVRQTIAGGAQALVVHHGLFWKFHGARPIVGPFFNRVAPLIRHGVNLFGYHLPLDAHPEVGNAAVLGRMLGLQAPEPFGLYQGSPTGVKGHLPDAPTALELQAKLRQLLSHDVLLTSPDAGAVVNTLGIITGGANGEWRQALQDNLDAYLTGEMSEHDWHDAQEAGMHMFAGGHHATEQFGIQALMQRVQRELPVECFYIGSLNPA